MRAMRQLVACALLALTLSRSSSVAGAVSETVAVSDGVSGLSSGSSSSDADVGSSSHSGGSNGTGSGLKPPSGLVPTEPDPCIGVPRNTLLATCPTPCIPNGACIAYDQSPGLSQLTGCDYATASEKSYCTSAKGTAKTCEFHCFAVFIEKEAFKFYVTFESQLGERINRVPEYGGLIQYKTQDVPFQSNQFVRAIGKLSLLETVSTISIAGGRTTSGTRGRVVDLTVDPYVFAKAPQVTTVELLNMDLRDSLVNVLTTVPQGTKKLDLSNTRLTKLPVNAFSIQNGVEILSLRQNELSSVSREMISLPKLTELYLSENNLRTFDASAPNLEILDLTDNALTIIPPAVFSYSNLRELNLGANPIVAPLVLTDTQLRFLNGLRTFTLNVVASPTAPPPSSPTNPSLTRSPISVSPNPSSDGSASGSPVTPSGTLATASGSIPIVVVSEDAYQQYADAAISASTAVPPASAQGDASLAPSKAPTPGPTSNAPEARSSNSTNQNARASPTSGSGKPSFDDGSASTQQSRSHRSVAALASIVVVICAIVSLGIGFLWRKRRQADVSKVSSDTPDALGYAEVSSDDGDGQRSGYATGSGSGAWWASDDMLSCRMKTSDIEDVRVVGSDEFTATWLVQYRGNRRQLVSKRLLQNEHVVSVHLLKFVAEAKLSATLTHPSIVQFVGVAWTNTTDLQMLHEYMPQGDLLTYLHLTSASALPWQPDKLKFAVDIIEALVYTHSFSPPLLHRDVKCSNVLLNDDFKAKLANFGSARLESDNNTMTRRGVDSGLWSAPEILSRSSSYGPSSDIYSFGVVLCELDTHQVPHSKACGGGETAVSPSCPHEIRDIAQACLASNPADRPTAIQVAFMLRSVACPRRLMRELHTAQSPCVHF